MAWLKRIYQRFLKKLDLYLVKKLEVKFLQKQLEFAEKNLYKGIDDMPIFNWHYLNKNNDLSWLYISKPKGKKRHTLFLKYQLKKISDELVDVFGFTKEAKEYYQLLIDIEVLKIDLLLTKDKSIQTDIEIKEFKVSELSKSVTNQRDYFFSNKIAIEEHLLKSQINLRTTTMREYYEYIFELKRRNK